MKSRKEILKNSNIKIEEISSVSYFNNKFYSGRDEKYGITFNDSNYILKVPVGEDGIYKLCAEYIASYIYKNIGLPVQKVEFVKFDGNICLAVEDFLNSGETYVPLGSLIEEQYDIMNGNTEYSYENFYKIIMTDDRIAEKKITIHKFWIIFVVDFLIANRGRNASNLGFKVKNKKFYFAPVFDNASSFFVGNQDMDIKELSFPIAKISFKGKNVSNYNIIKLKEYAYCKKAISFVLEKFDLKNISNELNELLLVDYDIGKKIKLILETRYNILKELI